MRRVSVPLAVLLMAALAGCSATREGGGPVPSPSVSTSTAPAPSPTLTFSADPSVQPTPPGREPSPRPIKPSGANTPKVVNVTGTVTEGVEPGCLLLDNYLLINAPTSLVYAGVKVRLTLEVRTDLVSTCQQGTPAMITSAQRL
ncbi:hypothetical protein AB0J74_04485 [Asanoa sp. NPDC049573]|uniref:hypothetical protein n=1 Tax=Asanoa sp. NPDC049573 TaxID=3155396 RepID=UPI00343826BA